MQAPWWPHRIQGAYYVATGLWPLVALRSYMRATGQESHGNVARVLGAAVAAAGVLLATGLLPDRHARRLGLWSAVALGAGGTSFALMGRGVPVNLGDAALQSAFAAAWWRRA